MGTPNIDKQILVINRNICRHIAEANGETRGMVSQDILAQLRNFVEHIMLKSMLEAMIFLMIMTTFARL